MITLLRQYLLGDEQIKVIFDNKPAIFQVEKPLDLEFNPYIVIFHKPLIGGFIKDYQLEFRLIGKDLSKLNALQSRLIKLLDNPRENLLLKNETTTIRQIKLLNGGGQLKNPNTGNFEIVLFFLVKI